MGSLIGLAVLVIDIIAILDCLKSSKPGGQKALWIVLILIAPLLGIILYYLVGKKSA